MDSPSREDECDLSITGLEELIKQTTAYRQAKTPMVINSMSAAGYKEIGLELVHEVLPIGSGDEDMIRVLHFPSALSKGTIPKLSLLAISLTAGRISHCGFHCAWRVGQE